MLAIFLSPCTTITYGINTQLPYENVMSCTLHCQVRAHKENKRRYGLTCGATTFGLDMAAEVL